MEELDSKTKGGSPETAQADNAAKSDAMALKQAAEQPDVANVVAMEGAPVPVESSGAAEGAASLDPDIANVDASDPDIANVEGGAASMHPAKMRTADPDIANFEGGAASLDPDIANVNASDPDIANVEGGAASMPAPKMRAADPDIANVEGGAASLDPDIANVDPSDRDIANVEGGAAAMPAPKMRAAEPDIANVDGAVETVNVEASISVDELMAGQAPVEEAEPAATQQDTQLKAILEAIVYVAEEPLTLAQIAASLQQPSERIKSLLDQLVEEFDQPGHGVSIREVAGGYKMATKPEHHEAVRNFVKSLKPPLKLSLPALETLAVIAYKQPVTGPEIMEIRGVQGLGVIRTLLDRKLIVVAGRKNVIGKPILYKTTKEFLIQFGLKDLSELPSLKEFEEIKRMAFADSDLPAVPGERVVEMVDESTEEASAEELGSAAEIAGDAAVAEKPDTVAGENAAAIAEGNPPAPHSEEGA